MSLADVILVGGGGHCRACIDVIEATGKYNIAGIVDKIDPVAGESLLGYPYLGTDDDLSNLRKSYDHALISVGQIESAAVRISLFERLKALDFLLPVIVSPRALVSSHATIGEGTVVMHFCCVNAGAIVGNNCILNTHSLVEHDSIIGDHSHVSTMAVVNGGVTVGERSFLGSGSVIVQGVSLGADSFIRANSLIARQP